MITCYHGVTPFTSAQGDMRVNDIVMSTCPTHEANGSGNIQIYDRDLDIRRVDEASQPDLPWTAPGLRNYGRRDTQRSSAMPELFDAGLHHLSLCSLIQSEECAGVESKTSDPTFHPTIRSS
jgi:hypothetical protein